MSCSFVPAGYRDKLGIYNTQIAIGLLRTRFQEELGRQLTVSRVSAPLFVSHQTGLNDDLNGVERPVSFDIKETGDQAEVVHSLAKWKRMALYNYGFQPNTGLYTDMNAIRRDEEMDNLHSIYVDQWDWEKVITPDERNIEYLKEVVRKIVDAICNTCDYIHLLYPCLTETFDRKVTFITTQELEDMYPGLTPKEREREFCKAHHTAFIMQIGDKLASGQRHDGRAPDYDDWKLNGDILFWNPVLEDAFEVSSMGIRVDPVSLDEQLTKADCDDRRAMPFHRMLLQGKLPLTIGGGIGQSRLCMLLLEKAHIGEVQSSVWDEKTREICANGGIHLL